MKCAVLREGMAVHMNNAICSTEEGYAGTGGCSTVRGLSQLQNTPLHVPGQIPLSMYRRT
eukprot:529930-Rhodomonas_salina.1